MPPPRRILGLDPGTVAFGWGVIEAAGSRLSAVAYGVLRPKRTLERPARLAEIRRGLVEVLETYRPAVAALEEAFIGLDPRAALRGGEARGIALASAAEAGMPVLEIPPATVKKAVAGNGRASKEQIARMVRALLNVRDEMPEDASDALSVAIAGSSRMDFVTRP